MPSPIKMKHYLQGRHGGKKIKILSMYKLAISKICDQTTANKVKPSRIDLEPRYISRAFNLIFFGELLMFKNIWLQVEGYLDRVGEWIFYVGTICALCWLKIKITTRGFEKV